MIIGNPITDFEEISSFDISSKYYMLVSERDMYVHDEFNSRKVDSNIVGIHSDVAVVNLIKQRFGNVAYMDISSFSPKDHTHNYSNITEIITYCESTSPYADKMGVIFLNGKHMDIYYDQRKNCKNLPSIGDTAFVCENTSFDTSEWKCDGIDTINGNTISSITYVGNKK